MKRVRVWKVMVGIVPVALVLAFCLVPLGRMREFRNLARRMDPMIRSLRPTDPLAVSPVVWDCAVGATITAYGNVCFSSDHVAIAEMYRLQDDLDRKLAGPIDLDTLGWIWDRLALTGPHGASYVQRHRNLFDQCLPPQPGK